MRVEAELLMEDAASFSCPSAELGTPEERRADAFVELAQRISEAWQEGYAPMP